MIKFFRHIRKKLISENHMGKYFKYAIGEILLVVIGILIALSINNWNENRKLQNSETKLLTDLLDELEFSYKEISEAMRNNTSLLNQYKTISRAIENDVAYNQDSLGDAFSVLPFWSSPYLPKTSFESIKNRDLNLIRDDSLRKKIIHLYEYSFPMVIEDYNRMEWNFSQSITLPVLLKNINRDVETGEAMPIDFEALKTNQEYTSYLNQLIGLRQGGIFQCERALNDITSLIEQISIQLSK